MCNVYIVNSYTNRVLLMGHNIIIILYYYRGLQLSRGSLQDL